MTSQALFSGPPRLMLAAADGSFSDALSLSVVGMGVVFTSLIVLALIVWAMSKVMPETEQPTVPKRAALRGPVLDGGIDATTLAIIAAAATVAVGQAVEVRDVRPAKE
jgi:sodium pump decarboxylase gamma subunit